MRLAERPRSRDDLIFRQVEEDFVVYDPVTDRTALLNLSAAAVLDFCDGGHTAGEIAAEVAAAFGEEERDILADVEATLNDFMAQGFFEPAQPEPALRPETSSP